MSSIRVEFYKSKELKGGLHPITITVTKDGVIKRKTIASALPKDWDAKNSRVKPRSRKDHEFVNNEIEDAFAKYRKKYKILCDGPEDWRAGDVFVETKELSYLFEVNALAYLASIEHKSVHSYQSASSRLAKIMRFAVTDFKISDIDENWIARFEKHCKTKEHNMKGELGNSDNTIMMAIKFIKRVISFSGIQNPALVKKKVSFKKTVKRKLTAAELVKIEQLSLIPGSSLWHIRNFFLLAMYFRGMRAGDLLQLNDSHIQGDRLVYASSKASHSYDLKIIPQAREILNHYPKRGTVFPFLSVHEDRYETARRIKSATALINGGLEDIRKKAGIDKKISTHIARHTVASLLDKNNVDLSVIQDILGHGSRSMTEGYLADLRQTDELDDAMDNIFTN